MTNHTGGWQQPGDLDVPGLILSAFLLPPPPSFLPYLCMLCSYVCVHVWHFTNWAIIFLRQRLTIVGSAYNLRLTVNPGLDWIHDLPALPHKAKVSGHTAFSQSVLFLLATPSESLAWEEMEQQDPQGHGGDQ